MIKLEELRIGNWVYFKDPARNITTPIQINYIDGHKHIVGYKSEFGDMFCEQKYLEPITLTEEKLLECGFESNNYGEKYDPDDEHANLFEYRLNIGIFYRDLVCQPFLGWYVFIEDSDMIDGKSLKAKNIYYLHELQNFCFVINGKELEVKL